MKKILFSFLTILLAAGNPIAAQESGYTNSYGVKLESMEEIDLEPLHSDSNTNCSDSAGGPRRVPTIIKDHKAKKCVISYMSLDGKKNPIRLTATIYIQNGLGYSGDYDKLLLNCHPTVTSNFEAPTGGKPVDEAINRICDDNFLVVCPDYCGYGISAYKQHPYLIHDVTARNCIDGAMAALDYVQNELGLQPTTPETFSTYIVGYSQGGATALACAKYLESEACPQATKDRLKLKETCCGDGPYSTVATINQYIEWGIPQDQGGPDKDLEYPCVLPLIVAAAKEAYGDGCMRTVEIEDYFSDEFKATHIIDKIKNKNMTTVDLNADIKALMPRLRPVDVFSENIINKTTGQLNTETNEFKCLMRAMDTNELAVGWVPQHPVTFFHLKKDGVVPYANYEAVRNGIQKGNSKVRYISYEGKTLGDGLGALLEVQDIPMSDGKVSEDLINHANGGTYFYVMYMFGSDFRGDDEWKLHL